MTEAEKRRQDVLDAIAKRDAQKTKREPTPIETDGLRIKPQSRGTNVPMRFIHYPRGWVGRPL